MNHTPDSVWKNPVHWLAFGCGSGTIPFAPGTFGTLAAVVLYIPMAKFTLITYILVLVLTFLGGIYLCGRTAKDLQQHDHSGIVWDEFVGYWITMLAAPPGWVWIVTGFLLFRLFDISKPWPINWVDRRVGGGLGIMLDDLLAGLLAALCLQVLAWWVL